MIGLCRKNLIYRELANSVSANWELENLYHSYLFKILNYLVMNDLGQHLKTIHLTKMQGNF